MIALQLSRIATIVGGTLHGADVEVSDPAYVDSRSPQPKGLFIAIAGERSDGHDYADDAHAVLGSRPTGAPTVVVEDPVAALGLLARHVIGELSATVIALTGSQGKTGTKDYLASVLRTLTSEDAVVATAANNNNELGVPLTVLRAGSATSHVVIEMGARGIGHIQHLCSIVPPRIGGVLNVGSAHVGEFGNQEAIAQTKGELIAALPISGLAVLNADDPLVSAMAIRTAAPTLTFGRTGMVTWRNVTLDGLGRPTFELGYDGQWHPVTLLESGPHQVLNAAAAAALAIGAGFDAADVAGALGSARSASPWRMEVTERADGLVVINDAYNANPESMRAGLMALMAIAGGDAARPRRSIAILGEMKELGDEHDAGHRAVGADAAAIGVDVLVVVGEAARGMAEGAEGAGGACDVIVMASREQAAAWVRQNAGADDVVLIKASRGAALEWVAEQLVKETTR